MVLVPLFLVAQDLRSFSLQDWEGTPELAASLVQVLGASTCLEELCIMHGDNYRGGEENQGTGNCLAKAGEATCFGHVFCLMSCTA